MGPPPGEARRKTLWRNLLLLVLIGGAAAGFVSFGPPGLYAKAATPEFCAGCHVMEYEYENWFHNGGHRNMQCVACHLPNDNPAKHAAWKGLTGMQDVFAFYSGRVPETIKLSQSGAAIVLDNCKRCHNEMVSRINEERQCWDCHRRLSHRTTGAM
jgi:cytochrome c nitrite reductase small subunit